MLLVSTPAREPAADPETLDDNGEWYATCVQLVSTPAREPAAETVTNAATKMFMMEGPF